MADALTASVKLTFVGTLVNTLTNLAATTPASVTATPSNSFTDGVTGNQADKLWFSINRALTGATSETIDVYDFGTIDIGAGAGKDPLGQSLTLAEIALLLVINDSTSTGTLTIGNDGTAAAWQSWANASDTGAVTLLPGGIFLITAPPDPGFAVADTSNHLLKAASSATLTYGIYILGRSA